VFAQFALIVATAFILLTPSAHALGSPEKTKTLIAVLQQTDASLFEKARACQQLGEIGTPEAVPALAALLTDPKLSAYARSGLEGIPDPSAASALRDAAQKIKGPLLAGVINSLGVLRDVQAVDLLARLAADPDSGVVKEALLALGNISTPESIRIVREALANGPEAFRGEAAAACLLAADRQRTSGDLGQAVALYDLIRQAAVPLAYRVGATRGAILAREKERVPFLIEQLRSGEPAIRNAALLTIREIPDDELATALNEELTRTSSQPEMQELLLWALADCHNPQSITAVQPLDASSNPEIRKTALVVLGRMGPGAAPALIEALQQGPPAEEKKLILNALRALPGSTVDDSLLQALASATAPPIQCDFIRLLDNRGVTKATGEILKHASSPDLTVSVAALSALKSLAGSGELPVLVAFAKTCGDAERLGAAENTLAGICIRTGEPASSALLNDLKQATTASERNSWIRVLVRIGYAPALPLVEAAASDPDPAVAENALAQLGRWPDPAPMETLLKATDSASSPALRQRALGSVFDLAATATDEAQRPEQTIVSWLQRAQPAAQTAEDQWRLIGLLARLKTVGSFQLLLPYLDNPDLRTEAVAGVIQIAPALTNGETAGAVKTALEKIAITVDNADLRDQAFKVLEAIPGPGGPTSLFDGHSLAGWEGDTNVWRVRDGVIVGGSLSGNPRNEFLATRQRCTNFILRLEYKLVGTEGFVNSGVQFRSERMSNPPNEMIGYQADIGAGYSGCLYDESRRNKFLVQAGEATIKRLEKPGDWNRYEIHGEGPHMQIWLNGEKTVDYTEPDANLPQSGLFGLQIHGGNKAEVSFRNIELLEL
jgi:HEAT repeat protein